MTIKTEMNETSKRLPLTPKRYYTICWENNGFQLKHHGGISKRSAEHWIRSAGIAGVSYQIIRCISDPLEVELKQTRFLRRK